MQSSVRVLLVLLALAPLFSRAETFGALTFPPQKGKARISPYAISYMETNKADLQVVTFFRESASSGDSAKDFEAEWEGKVTRLLSGVGERGTTKTVALPDGWKLTVSSAPMASTGLEYQVHLGVYSGHGLKASVRMLLSGRLDPKARRPVLFDQTKPFAPSGGPRPAPLPSGFQMAIPAEFKQVHQWYAKILRSQQNGRNASTAAMFRVLDPVEADADKDFGLALRELWKTNVPAGFVGSRVLFRRYVGEGLAAWFVAGRGREIGRAADTLFQLFLINLGEVWQPIVVAQVYEDPDNPDSQAVAAAGLESFAVSSTIVEEILKEIYCPGVEGGVLGVPNHLVGEYRFGSESGVDWIRNPIGPIETRPARTGGSLSLKADGTYEHSDTRGAREKGTWTVDRDLLVLSPKGGQDRMLRIACITQFSSGKRLLVLLPGLNDPVNPWNLADSSTYYLALPSR